MKRLLALLLVISSLSFAKQRDFDLRFETYEDQPTKIIYNSSDWQRVTNTDEYIVFVEKNIIGRSEDLLHFHALTIYNDPFFYDTLKDVVEKVYTYGIMNCSSKQLAIINEFYVKTDDTVIYTSNYQYGSHIIEMDVPDTLRFEILTSVCNKSI